MVASPAQRPTIAEAATRLSSLRQSLYGSDVTITRLRDALRRAHERMVRVTGCCVRVSAKGMPVNETVVPLIAIVVRPQAAEQAASAIEKV